MRDELYDQLLASLTQGGEPIATDEDYSRWVESWRETRRGEALPDLGDARMPWHVQRRRALMLVSVIDQDTFCTLEEVAYEIDSLENAEEGKSVAPFDSDKSTADWSHWKERTIEMFGLGGLILDTA